ARLLGRQQVAGGPHAVAAAGAGRLVQVERDRPVRADALPDQQRHGRQRLVVGEGGDDDRVQVGGGRSGVVQGGLRRRDAHVGGGHAGRQVPAPSDARALPHTGVGGVQVLGEV